MTFKELELKTMKIKFEPFIFLLKKTLILTKTAKNACNNPLSPRVRNSVYRPVNRRGQQRKLAKVQTVH